MSDQWKEEKKERAAGFESGHWRTQEVRRERVVTMICTLPDGGVGGS